MSKVSAYFTVNAIDGKGDVKELKRAINTLPGVKSVSVNARTDKVAVDFDTSGVEKDRIQKKIESLGYSVLDTRSDRIIQDKETS